MAYIMTLLDSDDFVANNIVGAVAVPGDWMKVLSRTDTRKGSTEISGTT